MVTQIDEQQIAVIALTVDPTRQADGLADLRLAELGAVVGAIGVHITMTFGWFARIGARQSTEAHLSAARNTGRGPICQGWLSLTQRRC